MPVTLSVRTVREAIYREAGFASGGGSPVTAALGSLFHSAVAGLLGASPERSCHELLANAEKAKDAWIETLRRHLYRGSIGPYIGGNRAGLESSTSELMVLWEAVGNFSAWAGGVLWKAHHELGWPASAREMVTCEESLSLELREPGWTDSVLVTGVADSVWRVPRGGWCVVEYKLGRTSPEADLAQACLYHQMLAGGDGAGTLALVSFEPELRERLFQPGQLAEAQKRIAALIGHLAGVSGDGVRAAEPVRPRSDGKLHTEMARTLLQTLEEFGAPAVFNAQPVAGPSFIRFFLSPARGVKTKAVMNLARELQIRMNLANAPIMSVSGGSVAIDVMRPDPETLLFRDIRDQIPAGDAVLGSARFPIGVDLSRRLMLADLSEPKHAHFLVAGTTGSGKSEWLRMAIAGLLLGNTPKTLRLLLIDPKRSAFNELRGSPFLFEGGVVYPDEQPAANVFERLVAEMEKRYGLFQEAGVDSLREYVAASGEPKPRIVCICDEYADLIKGSSRRDRETLERQFTRLGSKARAAGIHLIIATQEARRETIRGSLDANLPARVGLRMGKDIESRLLLGRNGAEHLMGNGDLLFKDIGDPVRLQAPLLPREEREALFCEGIFRY
jgi:hypothetical protein